MNDTCRAVLAALADGPVSGPDLADHLDVSRASVWKHVEALREAGFEIPGEANGYRLVSVPDYGGPAIEYGLEAPFDVEYHDAVASTNDRGRELAEDGAADVVVVADEQTGGRGRLDRGWSSPPGGVWLSLVLRPDLPPAHVPLLTLAAAVAVTRAAREAGVDAGIKWPNDVLVSEANEVVRDGEAVSSCRKRGAFSSSSSEQGSDGVLVRTSGSERKLSGILTEMEGEADRVEWVVVGVGVNVNVDADALPGSGTSVREQVGDVTRRTFVQRLLEAFDDLRGEPDDVLAAWEDHALTLGRAVRVETPAGDVVGEALRVEHPGTLVVRTDEGVRRIHAGDCEHLRPAA
jgi:BirA family biotin operon repressor/biotin-[acetyl-CoA-carboxylase] ligase